MNYGETRGRVINKGFPTRNHTLNRAIASFLILLLGNLLLMSYLNVQVTIKNILFSSIVSVIIIVVLKILNLTD